MIGGGNWNRQNKILNGVYINFVSKKKSSTSNANVDTDSDTAESLLLVDKHGVLLKTADGFYLAVKGDSNVNEYVLPYTAAEVETAIGELLNPVPTGGVRIAEVELIAANWVGDESPYSQIVNIPGITENSQVDLTPSVEQLTIFHEKDLSFVTENEDGVVTVYAIGQRPENDYTMQVTIKEVSA